MNDTLSTLTLDLSEPFKIVVENRLNTISPYVFLEQETWFEPEVPFFHAYLQPGMRVIDIGTNCGFYTLLAAHKVGDQGHVFGFEPGLKPARLLKQSLRINNYKNVTLYEAALGKKPGTTWFLDKEQTELSAVVSEGTAGARAVRVESLDHLYHDGEFTGIDFIKIDAEGFEDQVILGGKSFFARESPLVMLEVISETDPDQTMGPAGMLKAHGYEFYRYCPGLNALVPLVLNKHGDYVLNIFLCRPDRASLLREAGLLVMKEDFQQRCEFADPRFFADYFVQLPAVQSCRDLQDLAAQPIDDGTGFAGMIAEFLASQDKTCSLAERFIRLDRAERWIDRHFQPDLPFEQLVSFIRVWSACGRIVLVSNLLKTIAEGKVEIRLPLSQRFLPMSEAWEKIVVINGALHKWLASMMAEKLELSGSFSSIYKNAETLQTYELLRKYGYLTPALERRAALVSLSRNGNSFIASVFINSAVFNQKIWNEIAIRLARGERNIVALDAGTLLQ